MKRRNTRIPILMTKAKARHSFLLITPPTLIKCGSKGFRRSSLFCLKMLEKVFRTCIEFSEGYCPSMMTFIAERRDSQQFSSSDKPVVDITTRHYKGLNRQRSKPQTLFYKAARFVEYRKSRELPQPARYCSNVIQDHHRPARRTSTLTERSYVLVRKTRDKRT